MNDQQAMDMILGELERLALSTTAYPRPPEDPSRRDVVLHLQPEVMQDERGNMLPVRVVNGEQGCYPFLDYLQMPVAEFFGSDADRAREKVDEINARRGYNRERAREIIIQSYWR